MQTECEPTYPQADKEMAAAENVRKDFFLYAAKFCCRAKWSSYDDRPIGRKKVYLRGKVMKILYCGTRWPWPADNGRSVMIDQMLSHALLLGETHFVTFAEKGLRASASHGVAGRLAGVTILEDPSTKEVAASLMRDPTSPLQCHLLNSSRALSVLSSIVESFKPDIIIFDMVRSMSLARTLREKYPAIAFILDMDDLLSLRYRRMLQQGNRNIASTYASRLPLGVQKALARLPVLALRIEASLIRRAEARVAKTFDAVCLVSGREAALIKAILPDAFPVFSIAPSVGQISYTPVQSRPTSRRIVFLGNGMQYANAEALIRLDEIAKMLKHKMGAKTPAFEVAGKPNSSLQLPNLKVHGYVDNLEQFLSSDSILVAPMSVGTGVKLKILDAFSRGIPVVTTSIGVESIDVVPNIHFTHCQTNEEFAEALYSIFSGDISEKVATMALAAQEQINNVNNPTVVSSHFATMVAAAVSRRAALLASAP